MDVLLLGASNLLVIYFIFGQYDINNSFRSHCIQYIKYFFITNSSILCIITLTYFILSNVESFDFLKSILRIW